MEKVLVHENIVGYEEHLNRMQHIMQPLQMLIDKCQDLDIKFDDRLYKAVLEQGIEPIGKMLQVTLDADLKKLKNAIVTRVMKSQFDQEVSRLTELLAQFSKVRGSANHNNVYLNGEVSAFDISISSDGRAIVSEESLMRIRDLYRIYVDSEPRKLLYDMLQSVITEYSKLRSFLIDNGYDVVRHPIIGYDRFLYEKEDGSLAFVPQAIAFVK